MFEKIKTSYQRIIYSDIMFPRHQWFRRLMPWIFVFFVSLLVGYYFTFFKRSIWNRVLFLKLLHHDPLTPVRASTVMYQYDHLLLFLMYLFFVFVFLTFSFIAFDTSQRNAIVRRLVQENKDKNKDQVIES